jgi:integrase
MKWLEEDPTVGVNRPKVKAKQTPPFTENEMTKILSEAENRILQAQSDARANALRARALILFMRYSGLRISDALGCQIEWVKDGRVRLITRKYGTHVDVALPPHVVQTLATCRSSAICTGAGLAAASSRPR